MYVWVGVCVCVCVCVCGWVCVYVWVCSWSNIDNYIVYTVKESFSISVFC